MSLLLKDFKTVQTEAFCVHYNIIKKELLEAVVKDPFQSSYYVGKNLSSQIGKKMVELFINDGFQAKLIYDEDDCCGWIVVTPPV